MKKKYLITAITAVITVCILRIGMRFLYTDYTQKNIKVGFVYIGDSSTPYTNNFVRSQLELEKAFPQNITTISKYNIPEENCEPAIRDLISNGCDLIFGTSYGYGEEMKKLLRDRFVSIPFNEDMSKGGCSKKPFSDDFIKERSEFHKVIFLITNQF